LTAAQKQSQLITLIWETQSAVEGECTNRIAAKAALYNKINYPIFGIELLLVAVSPIATAVGAATATVAGLGSSTTAANAILGNVQKALPAPATTGNPSVAMGNLSESLSKAAQANPPKVLSDNDILQLATQMTNLCPYLPGNWAGAAQGGAGHAGDSPPGRG
jgi:hypothetical protein